MKIGESSAFHVEYEFRIIYWKLVKLMACSSEIFIKSIDFYNGVTKSRGGSSGEG